MPRLPARLTAFVLVVALAAGASACSDDDDSASTSSSSSSSSAASSSSSTSSSASSSSSSTSTAGGEATDLEDGRHPAELAEVALSARTLTVDVIQFLTGEEARAAHEDETGDPEGPPNDYFIKNENTRLRTLPVAQDVTVRLVRLGEDGDADLDPGTFDELPQYIGKSSGVFWLTLAAGSVTEIEEQYLP